MAITKEQAEEWAGPGTSADVFPIPFDGLRLTQGRLYTILDTLLLIVECLQTTSFCYLSEADLPVAQDGVHNFLKSRTVLVDKLRKIRSPELLVLSLGQEISIRHALGVHWPPVRSNNSLFGFWHVRGDPILESNRFSLPADTLRISLATAHDVVPNWFVASARTD